ncbi:MAG: hypothetical protein AAFO91_04900 [Bacteroidota bacterium]
MQTSKPVKYGPFKREFIRRKGTPEEKQALAEWEKQNLTPRQIEAQQRQAEYFRNLDVIEDVEPRASRLNAATHRMIGMMLKGRRRRAIPTAEMYEASKTLLWRAYSQIIYQETGDTPIIQDRSEVLMALAQVSHWLCGLEEWHGLVPGQCIDPSKSLYLLGKVGTGKSTIARAAHFASIQLTHEYDTGLNLKFKSMDRIMTEVAANSSIKPLLEISQGHLVLDELRLRHLEYKHYGNDLRVVADLLFNRHDEWKQNGTQTIITTNIPMGDLLNVLNDERISDRLFQQYQEILFTGESFRHGSDS